MQEKALSETYLINNQFMIEKISNSLKSIFDSSDISEDTDVLERYSDDWSKSSTSRASIVVFPRHQDQIASLMKLLNVYQFPVLFSGGRTGLSGGASCIRDEIVCSFDKMNKIIEFDEQKKILTCQPGTITESVQNFAKDKGLFYPVNFSSSGSSQIGGNISTNAGGINVIKYGMTGKYVYGLNAVLPNGDHLDLSKFLYKDATGPDMKSFFIGSEGILGAISEANIKLINTPNPSRVFVLGVNDIQFLEDNLNSLIDFDIEAIEIIDKNSISFVLKNFDINYPFSKSYEFLILIDSSSHKIEDHIFELLSKKQISDAVGSSNNREKESLWSLRLRVSESISNHKPTKFDLSFHPINLPKAIYLIDEVASKYPHYHFLKFGHIGDGNIHLNVFTENADKINSLTSITKEIYLIVKRLNGSISAEHGIGHIKREIFHKSVNNKKLEILKSLKKTFDPNNIINPGKLV